MLCANDILEKKKFKFLFLKKQNYSKRRDKAQEKLNSKMSTIT